MTLARPWLDDEPGVAVIDDVVVYADPLSSIRHDRVMPFWPEEHLLTHALLKKHVRSNDAVLDVGTGSGIFAIHAAKASARVMALDANMRAIAFALENAKRNGITASISSGLPEPGRISLRHDFFEPPLKARLQSGPTQRGFDVVIITPPYTLSCAPVSPALHAEAGDDGQAVFRNMAETAVPLLADGGVLICNQMSTVTADGSITAVDFLAKTFGEAGHFCDIEVAPCLPQLEYPTRDFLVGQYRNLLEFTEIHDPAMHGDIVSYIEGTSAKWPKLALFSLAARRCQDRNVRTSDLSIAESVMQTYGRTWEDRVRLHATIISTSVPSRAQSLPDIRAPVRDVKSAQWESSVTAQAEDHVRHQAIQRLGFDLDSLDPGPAKDAPGVDIVVIDAAPLTQNVMGYSGLTQEVTIWFSKRLRTALSARLGEVRERLAQQWQDNTRIQQLNHTGLFLHPWFTGAASPSDWVLMQHSVRMAGRDGDMADTIAEPSEWFEDWSRRIKGTPSKPSPELNRRAQDEAIALLEGPLQQLDVVEPTQVAAGIMASTRLEPLFALPGLAGRRAGFEKLVKRLNSDSPSNSLDLMKVLPTLSGADRALAHDVLGADAEYCHLQMHKAIDRIVSGLSANAGITWSSLGGIPLRIREVASSSRTGGLPEQYRGGVWVYMASAIGRQHDPSSVFENEILRTSKALWLNYLDRFALKSAEDMVNRALHHTSHQLGSLSSALADAARAAPEAPKLLADGMMIIAAHLRLFQSKSSVRNNLRKPVELSTVLDCAYLAAIYRLHELASVNPALGAVLNEMDHWDDEQLIQSIKQLLVVEIDSLPETWVSLLREARFVILLFHAAWQAFFHAAAHRLMTREETVFAVRFSEADGRLEVHVENTGERVSAGVQTNDGSAFAEYASGVDGTAVTGPYEQDGRWIVQLIYAARRKT